MIYENNESTDSDPNSLERFHIELLFSPGLYPCFLTEKEQIYEKRFNSHKKTPQPLSGTKKGKSNSTKSSVDQSEKEDTEAPATLPTSSSNKSNESVAQEPTTSADPTTPNYERTLLSSKQPSPVASSSASTSQVSAKKDCEKETHGSDDDDELTDHAVNLVVLGEVAGKKFSEMGKSNQQERISRKRHPTPELKSVLEDEAEYGRIHKNVKELGKCRSTDNEPVNKSGERRPLKIDTSLPRSKHPNTIVKSMSDILSNRTYSCIDEPSIAPTIDEDLLESPDSGLTLDANQATVGSAQTWAKDAKDILSANKNEADPQKQQTEGAEGSSKTTSTDQKSQQSSSGYQRPLLATIFSQNNESSETKQPETEEGTPAPESSEQCGGQISSQNSRDEESSNSTRRSRFPYRFKHHTVNLLTAGSGVENRLISTAVLMDTTRRKPVNNPAVLSTAVIARSSSAPRLQTFKAGDKIQVTEIKRFWPPLRSLEALCNVSFKQFDRFLERMLTSNTPLPSPPKTPILRECETENSFQRRLNDTIERLSMIEKAEKKQTEKKS